MGLNYEHLTYNKISWCHTFEMCVFLYTFSHVFVVVNFNIFVSPQISCSISINDIKLTSCLNNSGTRLPNLQF